MAARPTTAPRRPLRALPLALLAVLAATCATATSANTLEEDGDLFDPLQQALAPIVGVTGPWRLEEETLASSSSPSPNNTTDRRKKAKRGTPRTLPSTMQSSTSTTGSSTTSSVTPTGEPRRSVRKGGALSELISCAEQLPRWLRRRWLRGVSDFNLLCQPPPLSFYCTAPRTPPSELRR